MLYSPIDTGASEFDWPTRASIKASRIAHSSEEIKNGFTKQKGIIADAAGRLWIPIQDDGMRLKRLVATHDGLNGHRKNKETWKALAEHFVWPEMEREVATYVESCIQ